MTIPISAADLATLTAGGIITLQLQAVVAPPKPPIVTDSRAVAIKNGALVNAATGTPLVLKMVNLSGLEFVAIQGWDAADPWGGSGICPDMPKMVSYGVNAIRVPLNAASFLGLTVASTVGAQGKPAWGVPFHADPGGNYRSAVKWTIDAARKAGIAALVFDLHWCAPPVTLGGITYNLAPAAQNSFMDRATGLPFHQQFAAWLIATYGKGGFGDILIDVFNEPFLDQWGPGGNPDLLLLNGGTGTRIVNGSQGGTNYEIDQPWPMVGYQEVLNSYRALGCTNILVFAGNGYAQELSTYKTWFPKDPLNQSALSVHYYGNGKYPYSDGNVYPMCGRDAGGGTAQAYRWAEAAIAAGLYILIGEDGGQYGPTATVGEPHMKNVQQWAAKQGAHVGYGAWQFNNYRQVGDNGENFLMTSAGPATGAGVQTLVNYFKNNAP